MIKQATMDITTLMHKVLSGNASGFEIVQLNIWISSDPVHAEQFKDMKLLFENSLNIEEKISERDDRFYDGLRNILDRINALKRLKKRTRRFKIAGISACIASIVLMASIYFFDLKGTPKPEIPVAPGIVLSDNINLEEATLKSIIDILEDKYNLVIMVSSEELLSCRFTGIFYRGITIDDMIRMLAQSEDFNYTIVNPQTYELWGKGCPL